MDQGAIPGIVPELIVDLLEAIDIEHRDRDARFRVDFLDLLVERGAVEQPGQRIGRDHADQIALARAKLAFAVRQPPRQPVARRQARRHRQAGEQHQRKEELQQVQMLRGRLPVKRRRRIDQRADHPGDRDDHDRHLRPQSAELERHQHQRREQQEQHSRGCPHEHPDRGAQHQQVDRQRLDPLAPALFEERLAIFARQQRGEERREDQQPQCVAEIPGMERAEEIFVKERPGDPCAAQPAHRRRDAPGP